MSEQLPVGRGRSPWREPRSADDWVATIAWLQLGALLGWAAVLAYMNWAFADLDGIGCFDGDEPACAIPESGSWLDAGDAVASVLVLLAASVAVAVHTRRRRGHSSRAARLGALAATWLCACAAALLTDVPF